MQDFVHQPYFGAYGMARNQESEEFLPQGSLGFRVLGFRVLGFRVLGFRV